MSNCHFVPRGLVIAFLILLAQINGIQVEEMKVCGSWKITDVMVNQSHRFMPALIIIGINTAFIGAMSHHITNGMQEILNVGRALLQGIDFLDLGLAT